MVTTTALSAMEDEVLTVTLTVTATDPEGLSFSQEAEVFVAAEDYGVWEGSSVDYSRRAGGGIRRSTSAFDPIDDL